MTDISQKFPGMDIFEKEHNSIKEFNAMLIELEMKKQWWVFELRRSQKSGWPNTLNGNP